MMKLLLILLYTFSIFENWQLLFLNIDWYKEICLPYGWFRWRKGINFFKEIYLKLFTFGVLSFTKNNIWNGKNRVNFVGDDARSINFAKRSVTLNLNADCPC